MPLRLRITSENRELPEDQRVREFAACGGTIGRSADNDWVLPDDRRYVSSRHAIIDFQGGAYYLVDTSRNGVYVNGADTPVGRGLPQRLFDGDHLRIGEFEIAVDVSGGDESIPDDGMRDSIVRAQLVAEEESVELMLVTEDKLLHDHTLQRHLSPASDVVKQLKPGQKSPGRKPAEAVPRAAPAARAPARPVATPASAAPAGDAEQRALAQLLEAAGLKPDAVAGAMPGEVMQVTGKLLRALTAGLMDLLRERSQLKEQFRIPQTIIQSNQNNPLKFSPTVEEALRYLLNDKSERAYLGAEDAVRSGFRDLRQHDQAMTKAMLHAVREYAEHFDPEELKSRFDRGLKRSGLLSSANKLKYWELYEESYHELVQRTEGGPPQIFSDEFAKAYAEELDAGRTARGSR